MKGDMSRGSYEGVTVGDNPSVRKIPDMYCPQAGGTKDRFNFWKEACLIRQNDHTQFHCYGGCYKTTNRKRGTMWSRSSPMVAEVKKANSLGAIMYARVKGYIEKGLCNEDIGRIVGRKPATIKGYRSKINKEKIK